LAHKIKNFLRTFPEIFCLFYFVVLILNESRDNERGLAIMPLDMLQ
jgi:hypothetical protein